MYLSAFNEDGNLLDWWFAHKLLTVPNLKFDRDPNNSGGKDFSTDLVEHTLGADMHVETWLRGRDKVIPPIEAGDGINNTFDIKDIDFRPLGVRWAWPESSDNAECGTITDSDCVCVSDINGMLSQEKRGGGTLAFHDKELWTALSKTDLLIAPPPHSRMEQAR